jgi:L-fucose mutarotase/ribose pyranase (RbsD/FucU family)
MREKIFTLLTDKGTQASAEVARILIKEPLRITIAIEGMGVGKAKIKYGSAKALLIISEHKPEFILPYFNDFSSLLSANNNILKWTAIEIICNLSFADTDGKIDKALLNDFFQMITGDSLIAAAHVAGNLWKIAVNDKHPADNIAFEMLKCEDANISEECKAILAGHVMDSFAKFFDLLSNDKKEEVLTFAQKQTNSQRGGTRRKAKMFINGFKC